MTKDEIIAKINLVEKNFIDNLAYPDGGQMTRPSLRNVDADIIVNKCIVFKNNALKYIIVPFSFRAKFFPSTSEIYEEFIESLIVPLIQRNASLSEDEKNAMIDMKDEWYSERVTNPENAKKLSQYNALKKELEDKGII
jgi:hypothetical protein